MPNNSGFTQTKNHICDRDDPVVDSCENEFSSMSEN